MNFDSKSEVSSSELAAVLGITGRRVQQLAQDGKITPENAANTHLIKQYKHIVQAYLSVPKK